MELNQLRGFIAVAQELSFTSAAKKLYLTQPALSMQIKSLEEELAEPLFERNGKQLLLTAAGRVLLDRAQQIIELVEQTNQEVSAIHGLKAGRLTIGTTDTLCLYLMPTLIQFFRERLPGIDLHFVNRNSAEIVALVVDGTVDFGLVTLPALDARVEAERLFHREDVAICRPDHPLMEESPVGLEDMIKYPLLLLEKSSMSRSLLDQILVRAGYVPRQIMELGSVEVIKCFVEIGLGVSIVPGYTIEEELKTGRLYAHRLPWLSARSVGVVKRRKGYLPPAGEMFLKLFKNHVPDVMLCPI